MADQPPTTTGDHQHDEHDPELIAGLLDRDLADAERAIAQAHVSACGVCAELHADLVALAKANLELPIPARTRDFTLTPAMAAALVPQGTGEPVPVGARLTREMTASRSRHAAHDRLLIANLVDRSVSDIERSRAEELMIACSDCALLFDDLVALSAATRALPVPARLRDYTLTAADAERLRVPGWRRLLAAIGTSRDVLSRPLAFGLTTIGLAGLLVATIPSALPGAASSPERSTVGTAAGDAGGRVDANLEPILGQVSAAPSLEPEAGAAAAAAPAESEPAAPAPAASVGPDVQRQESDNLFVGGESSPLVDEPAADLYAKSLSAEQSTNKPATIGIAGLLLVAGLGLFMLRWTARRLGRG